MDYLPINIDDFRGVSSNSTISLDLQLGMYFSDLNKSAVAAEERFLPDYCLRRRASRLVAPMQTSPTEAGSGTSLWNVVLSIIVPE